MRERPVCPAHPRHLHHGSVCLVLGISGDYGKLEEDAGAIWWIFKACEL